MRIGLFLKLPGASPDLVQLLVESKVAGVLVGGGGLDQRAETKFGRVNGGGNLVEARVEACVLVGSGGFDLLESGGEGRGQLAQSEELGLIGGEGLGQLAVDQLESTQPRVLVGGGGPDLLGLIEGRRRKMAKACFLV